MKNEPDAPVPKTLNVTLSDAEIRRHQGGNVRQLRDPRYRELRFRYSTVDRSRGAWHVVVAGQWGKAGDYPGLNTRRMLDTLPAILARRAADPQANSTASHWATVGDLLAWYQDRMTRDKALSAKRKASARSALKCHLVPRLGPLALLALDRPALDGLLLWPMQERYALSFVRSVYGVLAVAFRQAQRLSMIASNPMAGLTFGDFVNTRIRAKPARLRGTDLEALLPRLADGFEAAPGASMLAVMMLCHGTRIGETRVARWQHIDLRAHTWFIPAGDTKTKSEHRLPLTAQVCALLRRYQAHQQAAGYDGPFLFPGRPRAPLSATQASTLFRGLSNGEWSSHDLRKVARTAWTDLGVDYLVGELLLNHALKNLDQVYIHTTAERLKRQALEVWHGWLDARGFVGLHGETEARCEKPPKGPQALPDQAFSAAEFPLPRRTLFDAASPKRRQDIG
ncbi:tyrosine-type recombinase/integrase [Pseudomonas sp. MWU12-2323]|nr:MULTISPECIES: site-specific integrase [unclassified Pseudomonas]MPQ68315.1 tyrosine-type recombinase/integrase [Pseudomonas sp. MWU12-2323]